MRKLFALVICSILLFSCDKEKNTVKVEDEAKEAVLLTNNTQLFNILENYLYNKDAQNTKSDSCESEMEELDFETGVVFNLNGDNKVIVISKDLGEFQFFNMYFYSSVSNTITFEDSELISNSTSVKSACSQACFDDIKSSIEGNHYLKSVYGATSAFLDLFISRGCYNECKPR